MTNEPKYLPYTSSDAKSKTWRKPNSEEEAAIRKYFLRKEDADRVIRGGFLDRSEDEIKDIRRRYPKPYADELLNNVYYRVSEEKKKEDKEITEGIGKVLKELTTDIDLHEVKEALMEIPDNHQARYNYLTARIAENEKVKGMANIDEATEWMKAQIKKEEKILAAMPKPDTNSTNEKQELQPLPDEALKIFMTHKMEPFRELEQRLFDRSYIDLTRKWQCKPIELVGLILALKDASFFKAQNITNKQIKDFFQTTYQTNINQQIEAARQSKADKHKQLFNNMINS
ncbi:MAG: hypothetical protein EPN37_12270 [Chitinophagaceae bacterium]|nr:MAG: hypothetical protein EPN37_12270 [Chitinophagaceae bacterium]